MKILSLKEYKKTHNPQLMEVLGTLKQLSRLASGKDRVKIERLMEKQLDSNMNRYTVNETFKYMYINYVLWFCNEINATNYNNILNKVNNNKIIEINNGIIL